MEKKKILFLSASMGGGHNAAVEAVQQAIEKYYPDTYEMKKVDIVSLVLPYLERIAAQLYDTSSKYAKIPYKAFFELSDITSAQNLIDRGGYSLLKNQLKPIAEEKPDLIIVCFPLFAFSVGKYLRSVHKRVPMITLITDTGDVHSAWIAKGIDYYIAPTKETALFLEEEGIKEDQIKLFGFTVKQWFYKRYDVAELRKEYKIPAKNRVIVYFGGVLGMGNVKEKVAALDKSLRDLTILVICGRNEKLKKKIDKAKFKNDVRAFGYVENCDIPKYYAMSNLVVTKAGGISVMEVVTSKRPVIITEVIPGQEEPNAEFIQTMGFGYVAKSPKKLVEKAILMLDGGDCPRIHENYSHYHLNEHSDHMMADFVNEVIN